MLIVRIGILSSLGERGRETEVTQGAWVGGHRSATITKRCESSDRRVEELEAWASSDDVVEAEVGEGGELGEGRLLHDCGGETKGKLTSFRRTSLYTISLTEGAHELAQCRVRAQHA